MTTYVGKQGLCDCGSGTDDEPEYSSDVVYVGPSFQEAALRIVAKAITGIFATSWTMKAYDPSRRFFRYSNRVEKRTGGHFWDQNGWDDLWSKAEGMTVNTVEEWREEEKQQTFYFNFDIFFKEKCINEGLSSLAALGLLKEWKEELLNGVLPQILLNQIQTEKKSFLPKDYNRYSYSFSTCEVVDIDWIRKHGAEGCDRDAGHIDCKWTPNGGSLEWYEAAEE